MNKTVTIAPVRKSIRVQASQAHAFEVFTAKIGHWWPKKASVGETPMKTIVIEGQVGGHWYELGENGARTNVGRILVWDPPLRFILTWDLNSRWKPETLVCSEVEVRFIAESPSLTRVELEHRNFEAMGAEEGASMRKDVDGGWPGMLELFKAEAER